MHVGIAQIAPGVAFASGIAAAVFAVQGWSVARGAATPGAEVRITTARSDSIAVTPSGLAPKNLTPSSSRVLRGSLVLFNATGVDLAVRLRADTPDADLDHVLFLRLGARGVRLFSGPLAALHQASRTVTIASHARTSVSVRAWIPAALKSGYQARSETVQLSLLTSPAAA